MLNNCKDFRKHFSHIKNLEIKNFDEKKYMIISFNCSNYLVIDIINKKNINDVNYKINNDSELSHYSTYNGDINELINLYYKNIDIFNIQKNIFYKVSIDNAISSIFINIPGNNISLSFRIPNQYLYETIFMNLQLNVVALDVKERISDMAKQLHEVFIPSSLFDKKLKSIFDIKLIKKIKK